MTGNKLLLAGSLCILAVAGAVRAGGEEAAVETDYYRVDNGSVDAETFLGWRFYHYACVGCHGEDATGAGVGPDLTESVTRLNFHEFELKVLNRYLITVPGVEAGSEAGDAVRSAFIEEIAKEQAREAGQPAMPAWQSNPAALERIRGLYGYLKARSDGALGPGKPGLMR